MELATIDPSSAQIVTAIIAAILGGGLIQGLARWRQMPADRSVAWVTAQDVVIENLGHELTRRDDEIRELRRMVRSLRHRVTELETRLDEHGPETY